jgi:hypothetical protein
MHKREGQGCVGTSEQEEESWVQLQVSKLKFVHGNVSLLRDPDMLKRGTYTTLNISTTLDIRFSQHTDDA